MEVGSEYDVEISEISPNGEGLATVKGFWIFVPNVKVGDKVRVKVNRGNIAGVVRGDG